MMSLGLAADDCDSAKTRVTDRNLVAMLLCCLHTSAALCSSNPSAGRELLFANAHELRKGRGWGGGGRGGAGGGGGLGSLPLETRMKQSALLAQWACWCLFNVSLAHPPAKLELFCANGGRGAGAGGSEGVRLGGVRCVLECLKLHPGRAQVSMWCVFSYLCPQTLSSLNHPTLTLVYQSILINLHLSIHPSYPSIYPSIHIYLSFYTYLSIHQVHRQGLALLLSLVAPDPCAKFSLVSAAATVYLSVSVWLLSPSLSPSLSLFVSFPICIYMSPYLSVSLSVSNANMFTSVTLPVPVSLLVPVLPASLPPYFLASLVPCTPPPLPHAGSGSSDADGQWSGAGGGGQQEGIQARQVSVYTVCI
ncbi:hypothetical protein B484DRAFT_109244 [Ochromonadaceae sp. CCMP2298]|nr:hypothetical protein B484DRAFT_109244 [Ochromonadaceae sp. CCMP2298]